VGWAEGVLGVENQESRFLGEPETGSVRSAGAWGDGATGDDQVAPWDGLPCAGAFAVEETGFPEDSGRVLQLTGVGSGGWGTGSRVGGVWEAKGGIQGAFHSAL